MAMKGAFFTLTALILGTLVVLSILAQIRVGSERTNAIEVRITTLSNFVDDEQEDLQRALNIAGLRALLSMSEYVATTGEAIPNINATIREAVINGTLNGSSSTLMIESSLIDWEQRVENLGSDINLGFELEIYNVSARHISPWQVEIILEAKLTFDDLNGLASFEIEKNYTQQISIIGFEDPFYSMHTLGRVTNVINTSLYPPFVSGNSTSNLLAHTQNGWYVAHNDSPSFLMRLQGLHTASEYGIESLVYSPALDDQDLAIYDRSAVDYIYFDNQSSSSTTVTGMPSWFRIDAAHEEFYEVEDLT